MSVNGMTKEEIERFVEKLSIWLVRDWQHLMEWWATRFCGRLESPIELAFLLAWSALRDKLAL